MSDYINTTQLEQHITRVVKQAKHDIASPLICLQFLCEGQEPNPSNKKSKLKVSKLVDRINSIINNILPAVQRINNTDKFIQKALISESIEKILAEKQYEYAMSDITFTYNHSEQVNNIYINTNIDAFERALSNLINNAVEACSDDKSGAININLDTTHDVVNLSIEDNGAGMADDIKNNILNNIAVTANKPNGQGIGFGQIQDTLTLSNAKLSIESTLGIGTKIILTFPISE